MEVVEIIIISFFYSLFAIIILFILNKWGLENHPQYDESTNSLTLGSIQIKRGSFEKWLEINPVLLEGELSWDYTNNKMKIGDGKTPWKKLKYLGE